MRVPVAHSPFIISQIPSTSPIPSPSAFSLLHQPTPFSISYPIPAQKAGNALVTSLESRVSMGSVDHLYSGALHKQKPIDLCFIDYQLMRYASPVTDISFYLSMSTGRGLRCRHYARLLDIYYGTLAAVLRQGSLDVNEVYPREIFERHLRKYSVLGLVEALIALKIITGDSEAALDVSEMNEKVTDVPAVDEGREALYIDRVNGVVDDFFSNGYSLDEVLGEN
ncbi:hypothetical protein EVAR_84530_1 [Eumeta japonica]|uniref:CHK kinase-like domain-containing protein n=1 Tax=Eumeta variegata TaxID=151549 RepID=A0A4C1UHP0_EUMVA|nr:hypothetical protein EVAR_84530_1 [Eumeta japonica]